jgi:hypothetical protein
VEAIAGVVAELERRRIQPSIASGLNETGRR